MYKQLKVKSRVRVPPALFSSDINEAVEASIKEEFEGVLDNQNGLLLSLVDVENIGDGLSIAKPSCADLFVICRFSGRCRDSHASSTTQYGD